MTRAHPYVLDGTRLIVPLYSDGFSFSLMAITDDWGATWKTSTPLVGCGNIQPSLARKKDGTLVAYMRDNGPPPKRLMISRSTRSRRHVEPRRRHRPCPTRAPAPKCWCSKNGHWVLIYNDLETGPLQPRRVALRRRRRDVAVDAPSRARSRRHRPIDAAASASITTRRSSRRPTARCTRPTATSLPSVGHPRRAAAPPAQGDQTRAFQRSMAEDAGQMIADC